MTHGFKRGIAMVAKLGNDQSHSLHNEEAERITTDDHEFVSSPL